MSYEPAINPPDWRQDAREEPLGCIRVVEPVSSDPGASCAIPGNYQTLQRRICQWRHDRFGDVRTLDAVDTGLVEAVTALLTAPTEVHAMDAATDLGFWLMVRAGMTGDDLLEEIEGKLARERRRAA